MSHKGPGRPKTGRFVVAVRLTKDETKRLDSLRRNKARGVYLGKLIMDQPLNAFDTFRLLKKSP